MVRRGLTLLELLIAVGLLLAAGALVYPAMIRGLSERAFEASVEMMRQHLLLARSHARSSRRPVEVVYRPPLLVARIFEPGADAEDATGFELDDDETQRLTIARSWAERPLADGVRLDDQPPDDMLAPAPPREPDPPPIRVAVYLPDGSALLGDPVWITDDQGRLGRLTVNAWTGIPAFERVNPDEIDPDDLEQEDADEQTPQDDPLERFEREPVADDIELPVVDDPEAIGDDEMPAEETEEPPDEEDPDEEDPDEEDPEP